MASIGSLFASLRLDSKGFTRSMNRAKRDLKGFASDAKKFSAQLTGFLGVGSFAGLGILTRNTIKYGDSVAKTADRIGLSTRALQEWRYVAEAAGIEANTFDLAVQRFGRRVGEAKNGTGELKVALQAMGISLKDQNGTFRSVDDLLKEYLDKLGRIEDVTVRNSLAMKGFDTEGVKLVNIAKLGSKGINDLVKEFNDLGGVIDESLLRQSEEVNQQFDKFSTILGVTAKKAVLEMLPKIQSLMQTLTSPNAIQGMKDAADGIFNIANGLFKAAGAAAEFVNQLGKGIGIKLAQTFDPDLEDQIIQKREAVERTRRGLNIDPDGFMADTLLENRRKRLDILEGELKELEEKKKRQDEIINSFSKPSAKIQQPEELKKPAFVPQNFEAIKAKEKADLEAKKERDRLAKEAADAAKKLAEDQANARVSLDEYVASLRDQNTAVQASIEGWSDYYDELKAVEEAQRILGEAGLELTEKQEDQVRALVRQNQQLNEVANKQNEVADAAKDLGFTFSSAFEDAIVNGAKLSDVLKGLEQDIIRIITRKLVTEPLGNAITGALGGGGLLGGIFGSIFGGGKALGGPVMAGVPYLVGEQGPELFVPPGSGGRIVPNNSVGGNLSVSINVNGVRDEGGLKMASSQIAAEAARAVQRGQRNL